VKGSPIKPGEQVQIGLWLITSQRAFSPHVPGQGSVHLNLWQALFDGHSLFTTHSGLQFGGVPWYSFWQEHTPCWFTFLHWLLGPQGDGLQGSYTVAWVANNIII